MFKGNFACEARATCCFDQKHDLQEKLSRLVQWYDWDWFLQGAMGLDLKNSFSKS